MVQRCIKCVIPILGAIRIFYLKPLMYSCIFYLNLCCNHYQLTFSTTKKNKEGHIKKEEKRDVLLHLLFLNLCCNNSPLTLSLSSRTPAALARPNLRLLTEMSQKNEQFALVSFLYSWISIVLYLSICAMIGMLVVQTWRLLLNFPASFRFVICKCIFSFFVNSNFSHF